MAVIQIPFLLPHEFLSAHFHQPGAKEEAMPAIGTYRSQRLAEACKSWKEPENGMVPLGLHGDGVPVQGRMNQSSVDFITINLCCSEKYSSERVPLVCLETRYNAGDQTCNALTEVIAWSLKKLGEGKYPTARHDGTPFWSNEKRDSNCLGNQCLQRHA